MRIFWTRFDLCAGLGAERRLGLIRPLAPGAPG
jgi:hypothetical protein